VSTEDAKAACEETNTKLDQNRSGLHGAVGVADCDDDAVPLGLGDIVHQLMRQRSIYGVSVDRE